MSTDVDERSGGLLVYVNENIPSRRLNGFIFEKDMQIVPVELNLKIQKWLIFSIYRPPRQNLTNFLTVLSAAIDFYTRLYDKILVIGDFNAEPQTPVLHTFMKIYGLYNHMKSKTCWKSPNGSCIDLILSNKKFSLKNTGAVETNLSAYHLLIYTMLKVNFTKLAPKQYCYRNYKHFNSEKFLCEIRSSLNNDIYEYVEFETIFSNVLDKYAPIKTKILRANNKPHMSKTLRKAIMTRSRLRNIANKTKLPEDMANYRKQRNLVVNLNKKARKAYFNSPKATSNSKDFWKLYKPFFSEKGGVVREKILLVNDGDIISRDQDVATVFNKYFSNITESLNIIKWNDGFISDTNDPIISALRNTQTILVLSQLKPEKE